MTTGIPAVPPTDPGMYSFLLALKQNLVAVQGQAAPASVSTAAVASIYQMHLSNQVCVLQADSSGVVSSFANANGLLTFSDQQIDVTPLSALAVVGQTNCTGTINTSDGTPVAAQPKGYYQVTALSANNGELILEGSYLGLTLRGTFSLSKALAGSQGLPGTGSGAISMQLSNVAVILPAYANGGVISYGTATGIARMFDGTTEVTAGATFSASAIGCTGTINTAANTPVNSQPIGYYQITAMSQPTATFSVTGVYGGITLRQIVNLVLAESGFEIVAAMPTTNLFQGRVVFYTVDNKLWRYDGTQWVTWIQAADVVGQISAAQIQDGVITTAKLLPGLQPVQLVTILPVPGVAGRIVYLTTDTQLYRDTGVAWTAVVPTTSLSGQIASGQIAANSITAGQIQAGAVTSNAMIANSITGDRIQAGTLAATAIAANSITAGQLQANSVTAMAIKALEITADKLAVGSITAAQIKSTTITALQIAVGTLTGVQIQGNSISGDRIIGGTIAGDRIAGNTITANNLQANCITAGSAAIADLAIGTAQLGLNSVSTQASITQSVDFTYKTTAAGLYVTNQNCILKITLAYPANVVFSVATGGGPTVIIGYTTYLQIVPIYAALVTPYFQVDGKNYAPLTALSVVPLAAGVHTLSFAFRTNYSNTNIYSPPNCTVSGGVIVAFWNYR